ncbi:TrmB family transcriptional regulator sugar-binding domain-containing protein [Streptomyces sp. NPDC127074]|uniref:TrmB family transcriptional regulator sugar-binding domain-containing protein n=1 Tax=Streptomyces sp. NPDC127074 TaxID=3347130 RepID=UPI0036478BF0
MPSPCNDAFIIAKNSTGPEPEPDSDITLLRPQGAVFSGEVERLLLEAGRLVKSAVDRHRSEERLLTEMEPEEGVDAAEQVIESAQQSLAVVFTGGDDQRAARLVALLGRAVARGVDVRLLGRVGLMDERYLLKCLEKYASGVDVRLIGEPLHGMVLADGSVSVVWSGSDELSREAVLVRSPAVLRNLRTLFTISWNGSAALEDHRRLSVRTRSVMARRILMALSSGRTDEAAAREIGMSVRTYRRNVAEITRELGANSRFQAGARAVELGLLPYVDSVDDEDSQPA